MFIVFRSVIAVTLPYCDKSSAGDASCPASCEKNHPRLRDGSVENARRADAKCRHHGVCIPLDGKHCGERYVSGFFKYHTLFF